MASLAALGIVSRDISESCRFYRALGIDVPEPPEGEDHVEAVLPSGLRLMFDTEELMRRIDPDWKHAEGHPITLAFQCEDAADVDATFGRLTEAGFTGTKEPYDAFWGQRYANVDDSDGNDVALFAPL